MTVTEARQALQLFGSSVVYVSVQDPSTQKHGIGTAFHIGDGYFVTARHVVDRMQILGIGRPDISQMTHFVSRPAVFHRSTTHPEVPLSALSEGPRFHPDDRVDVAIVRVSECNRLPVARFDLTADTLSEGELLLQDVLVTGFPPIAQSREASFVALRAEISSVIETYTESQRYLVLSGMARGGFSGGPVIGSRESIRIIGIVSRALLRDDCVTELGFIGALTPMPLFELLLHHGISIREVAAEMSEAQEILKRRKKTRGG